jgi:RNA polymerase sigma factor (TIGR02999 family)
VAGHIDEQLAGLLGRWSAGDNGAFDQLVTLLYDDLRKLAHSHLRAERSGHTLSTTALVNEAYLQFAERTGPAWRGRAQFFALLSRVMRHILVDYARHSDAAKRGGGQLRVTLTDDCATADSEIFELLAMDRALDQLAAKNERLAQLVECRYFGGMSEAEVAEALGVSGRTVERDWKRARAYLFTMLSPASGSNSRP